MWLGNQDLARLVGNSCVAVIYDSDISLNHKPINANLQGARYGLFYFTAREVVVAGSLAESGSSTSLYDLRLTVDEVPLGDQCFERFPVDVRDQEPDSCSIVQAR